MCVSVIIGCMDILSAFRDTEGIKGSRSANADRDRV